MHQSGANWHSHLYYSDSIEIKLLDPQRFPVRPPDEDLDELIASIRAKGLINPVTVRPAGKRFEVVAGSRRVEACRRLHWIRVPCIIRVLSEKEAFEVALIENVQRKTMGPIEEAKAFKNYVEQEGWGSVTALAEKIGKSQEYVSHRLSLLSLPMDVQEKIMRHQISPTVAEELLRLNNQRDRSKLAQEVVRKRLSLREVRRRTRTYRLEKGDFESPPFARNVENQAESFLDYVNTLPQNPTAQNRADVRYLSRSVLVFKTALSRLGWFIDQLPDDSIVKRDLASRRLELHQVADELIKELRGHRKAAIS